MSNVADVLETELSEKEDEYDAEAKPESQDGPQHSPLKQGPSTQVPAGAQLKSIQSDMGRYSPQRKDQTVENVVPFSLIAARFKI